MYSSSNDKEHRDLPKDAGHWGVKISPEHFWRTGGVKQVPLGLLFNFNYYSALGFPRRDRQYLPAGRSSNQIREVKVVARRINLGNQRTNNFQAVCQSHMSRQIFFISVNKLTML